MRGHAEQGILAADGEKAGLLTDTHAHICDAAFDADRIEVLERARNAGVAVVIAVGETLADAQKNIDLAKTHPMIRPAAGLYPTQLSLERAAEMHTFIRKHREELIAVGEVGLDYWAVQEEAQKEQQREIFGGFVALARELDLPLNVHSRAAGRHTVEFLLRHGAARVQLHAFDGKSAAALPAAEAGFFFSIPPSVVRSEQKQKLVRRLPLESLLVETDSPVLGPAPHVRNEPANIRLSLKAIAEIKGISESQAVGAVCENTRRLYGDIP